MKFVVALAVVLAINAFLFLGQTGIAEINPDSSTTFFNYQGSCLGQLDQGNFTLDEDVSSKFPQAENTVSPTSGELFTDPFSTIKNWLFDRPAFNYASCAINAVPNFLKGIGLPFEFVWIIGAFWHGLTLFLLVMVATGRGGF